MWSRSRINEYWHTQGRRIPGLLLGWPLFVTIVLSLLSLNTSSSPDVDQAQVILSTAVPSFTVSWFVFTTYAVFDFIRMVAFNSKWKPKPLAHFLVATPAILAGIHVSNWFYRLITNQPGEMSIEFGTPMIFAVLGGLVFIFFFSYRSQRREADFLRIATVEAELHVLRDQMRPHFLFNSLNSLAELIECDTKLASSMTQKLADLYRLILANSKQRTCSLASEILIARAYLELEKLRFDERLNFSFQANCDMENVYVPSLMIQTLVENGVKHGVARSENGGTIAVIVIRDDEGWAEIAVRNSGAHLLQDSGCGTGLENTRKRLDMLYGNRHNFMIQSNSVGETEVSFRVSGARFE